MSKRGKALGHARHARRIDRHDRDRNGVSIG
jgi:hypothetical protein